MNFREFVRQSKVTRGTRISIGCPFCRHVEVTFRFQGRNSLAVNSRMRGFMWKHIKLTHPEEVTK